MPSPLILLVDDAPDIGLIVRRFGRQAGQGVVVEPSAETAWEFLRQARRPDLAILDVHLPGASGFDLCRLVRAAPGLSDLPVALFSHWQRPKDVAAGLDAGADFLLAKDLLCQPDDWQRRLAEILQPPAGRCPPFFLRWLNAPRPELSRLARALGPALTKTTGGWLDPAVMDALIDRAAQTIRPFALSPDDLDRLRPPDGLALDRLASLSPEDWPAFLRAFAEQVWRLLGSAELAPFWTALKAAAPPDCESSPRHE